MSGMTASATAVAGDIAATLSASLRPKAKVHLAVLQEVPYPRSIGGSFLYPVSKALCGARTWGPAERSKVDCANCLRIESAAS